MKIGIMGGTFNPIHNTHLEIAKAAKEQFDLDVIMFIPSGKPGYKNNSEIVSKKHRLKMTELAVSEVLGGEEKGYSVNDIELKRRGNTYTCDTLKELKKIYPGDEFYFIIGGDSLQYFSSWRNPEEISKMAVILCAARLGKQDIDLSKYAEQYRKDYGADVRFIKYKSNSLSSTDIRHSTDIEKCVPKSVFNYIKDNGLYSFKKTSAIR